MKVFFVWPNKDSFGFKHIGISLLSAIAKRKGWQTRLFDTTEYDLGFTPNAKVGESAKVFKPVDFEKYGQVKKKMDLEGNFKKELQDFNPDVIAISVLSDEFQIAEQLTKIAKAVFPNLPIIWGNKYPTLNPEKTLLEHGADFICNAEGLEAFDEFLDALEGKRDIFSIKNIWARKNGSIIKNELRPLKKDLDDLPYLDWDIFDKRQFYRAFDGEMVVSGDHMLNWGCPYHCTYCINHHFHEKYNNKYFLRRYGVDRIIPELKYLVEKHQLNFYRFLDEDFLMRPVENLRELGEAYKKYVKVPFAIETNPKSITEEKVEILKDMNCVNISLAVETGDPWLRKTVLGRPDEPEDVIRAFGTVNKAKIRNSSFIMLGLPFESRETYRKTIEIVRKANVQYPGPGFFYPFEGTKLRDVSIEKGFFDPADPDNAVYRRDAPTLKFNDFSTEELVELHKVFSLYAKLPERYEPYIERSEKLDDKGIALRKKLIEIFNNTVFENDGWYKDDGNSDKYDIELKKLMD